MQAQHTHTTTITHHHHRFSHSIHTPPSQIISLFTHHHHRFSHSSHTTIIDSLTLHTPPSQILSPNTHHHQRFTHPTYTTIIDSLTQHTPPSYNSLTLRTPPSLILSPNTQHHHRFSHPTHTTIIDSYQILNPFNIREKVEVGQEYDDKSANIWSGQCRNKMTEKIRELVDSSCQSLSKFTHHTYPVSSIKTTGLWAILRYACAIAHVQRKLCTCTKETG